MTEAQENLQNAQANEKFWLWMIEEHDEIVKEEIEKLDQAKENFKDFWKLVKAAPEKLSLAQKNVENKEKELKKEQTIPATQRQEVLSLFESMQAKLLTMGVIQ